MDEFTERLLAEDKERAEHPERFEIFLICRGCHREWKSRYSKKQIEELVSRTGSNRIETWCDECDVSTEREEEE